MVLTTVKELVDLYGGGNSTEGVYLNEWTPYNHKYDNMKVLAFSTSYDYDLYIEVDEDELKRIEDDICRA